MGDTLPLNRVAIGDIRELAPLIAPNSVNCIVCSPPYMGLRDYGTARWEGGDAGCDHLARPLVSESSTLHSTSPKAKAGGMPYRDRCGKCGAVRVDRQLGLEPTVGEFVANLVAVFRALRPALRDDGTLWVNMGDSYSTGGNGGGGTCKQASNRGSHLPPKHTPGLPPKCLTLAPARFAIAMVEDGWILRSEMTGVKVAPMPESVRDRPTSATERLYLFVKQPRYWYDPIAVAEPAMSPREYPTWDERKAAGEPIRRGDPGASGYVNRGAGLGGDGATRNARNWFYWRPEPFSGSHYATFPSAIPRFAIRAGCPPRVCARCGAPWVRVVEREAVPKEKRTGRGWLAGIAGQDNWESGTPAHSGLGNPDATRVTTLGWRATCACDAGTVPGVVCDPFMGSGTTAAVAVAEGRRWIGADLDSRAITWTAERLAKTQIRLPLDLATEAAGG